MRFRQLTHALPLVLGPHEAIVSKALSADEGVLVLRGLGRVVAQDRVGQAIIPLLLRRGEDWRDRLHLQLEDGGLFGREALRDGNGSLRAGWRQSLRFQRSEELTYGRDGLERAAYRALELAGPARQVLEKLEPDQPALPAQAYQTHCCVSPAHRATV